MASLVVSTGTNKIELRTLEARSSPHATLKPLRRGALRRIVKVSVNSRVHRGYIGVEVRILLNPVVERGNLSRENCGPGNFK